MDVISRQLIFITKSLHIQVGQKTLFIFFLFSLFIGGVGGLANCLVFIHLEIVNENVGCLSSWRNAVRPLTEFTGSFKFKSGGTLSRNKAGWAVTKLDSFAFLTGLIDWFIRQML